MSNRENYELVEDNAILTLTVWFKSLTGEDKFNFVDVKNLRCKKIRLKKIKVEQDDGEVKEKFRIIYPTYIYCRQKLITHPSGWKIVPLNVSSTSIRCKFRLTIGRSLQFKFGPQYIYGDGYINFADKTIALLQYTKREFRILFDCYRDDDRSCGDAGESDLNEEKFDYDSISSSGDNN